MSIHAVALEAQGSPRGNACYEWALANGLNPANIPAGQVMRYDDEAQVARIEVFDLDVDGRRVVDAGRSGEFIDYRRRVETVPITTPPIGLLTVGGEFTVGGE